MYFVFVLLPVFAGIIYGVLRYVNPPKYIKGFIWSIYIAQNMGKIFYQIGITIVCFNQEYMDKENLQIIVIIAAILFECKFYILWLQLITVAIYGFIKSVNRYHVLLVVCVIGYIYYFISNSSDEIQGFLFRSTLLFAHESNMKCH